MIFIPNSKQMMMKLMQSQLKNTKKSKVMKNETTYQYKKNVKKSG